MKQNGTDGGDLRLLDTLPSIRHKCKVPEPNVVVPLLHLLPNHPHSISSISQLDLEPNYTHVIVPSPHPSPETIYPDPIDSHLLPRISLSELVPFDPQPNPSSPHVFLDPMDPQPNPPISHIFPDPVDPQPNPPASLDFPEAVDDQPNSTITHSISPKSIDHHQKIYKETSLPAPVPTKNLPSLQRRSRRSMTSVTKLHFDFASFVLVFFTFLHCLDSCVERSLSSLESRNQ